MISTTERILPWALRLTWIAVLVAGGAAIDQAVEDATSAVADTARYGGFIAWLAGVIAMAIPAVTSLTAVRIVVPTAVVVAVLAATNGAQLTAAAAFLVVSMIAVAVAFSAELGRAFVQASAYGEEDRHPLRPPVGYMIASVVTWAMWATAAVSAPLALADSRWILGGATAVVAVAGLAFGWPRWHRLSRRWFVIVPIGIVIHDQLVLAETLMIRRHELAAIRLAPADTEAADLTGPAAGLAVEITMHEPVTAIFAPTPRERRGRVVHMRAGLIAPSRPGRALRGAGARRLPVG